MKHYGLDIPEGSDITNITVPSGTSFPSNPNTGELFYLTSGTTGLYSYSGTAWEMAGGGGEGVPTSVVVDAFTGNGTNTQFTLSRTVTNDNEILVFITGVRQEASTYSVLSTNLTFSEAPPNQASIEVVHLPTSITGKTLEQTSFTATEGQTTFTVSYNVGYVQVYQNGARLVPGVDFTATNGTSVVLTIGATAGDSVEVVNLGVFAVADFRRKNHVINGNFDIWQYATTQTTTNYGSDDRWVNAHSGSTKTHSQQAFTIGQTDVPNNPKYFSRTVVASVAGSGNYCLKAQRIEDVTKLSGKTLTLSFWAKADANRNIAVELGQGFGDGGSPSASVTGVGVTTCNLTTTWKKYTVTTTMPSVSGKTLGTSNNDHLYFVFWFDAGSTLNSRTNSLGQQSGTFDIAQVQLEEGSNATQFEYRTYADELLMCQRYYHKVGNGNVPVGNAVALSATSLRVHAILPTRMRADPTVTLTGAIRVDTSAAKYITAVNQAFGTAEGMALSLASTDFVGFTVNAYEAHWLDLSTNNGSATNYLAFSAEL